MANRRILRANESEESVRQRAMNQAFKNFADYGARAVEANRREEATKRQKALQEKAERMNNLSTALTLSEKSGKTVTTEDVKRFKDTGHFEEQLKEGEFGPPAPSGLESILGGISQKQREAKKRKEEREDLGDWEKKYNKREKSLPFRQRQEAEKMRLQAELRAKADRKTTRDEAEKLRKRTVPGLGVAMTEMDAKDLKDASQMKAKLDAQIGEMIALRKKHGVEYMNREAVARGQQLSKDLLLTYKNLAKLGVLSQSDEAIVNAIIPADPLGQDWSPFGDSILSNLEKFKGDVNRDYEERLSLRLDPSFKSDYVRTQQAGLDKAPPPASQLSRAEKIKALKEAGIVK